MFRKDESQWILRPPWLESAFELGASLLSRKFPIDDSIGFSISSRKNWCALTFGDQYNLIDANINKKRKRSTARNLRVTLQNWLCIALGAIVIRWNRAAHYDASRMYVEILRGKLFSKRSPKRHDFAQCPNSKVEWRISTRFQTSR